MSTGPKSRVNASYHPHGYGVSPSLQRARKPFRFGNAAIGTVIALFAAGVYSYSISSVKQDDFSDVADLLPPASERANIRTIEDEAREKAGSGASGSSSNKMNAFQSITSVLPSRSSPSESPSSSSPSSPAGQTGLGRSGVEKDMYQPSSPSGVSAPLPSHISTPPPPSPDVNISGEHTNRIVGSSWIPLRLYELGWVQKAGLVESDKGNVLVWGAPEVDRIGKVGDSTAGTKGKRLV